MQSEIYYIEAAEMQTPLYTYDNAIIIAMSIAEYTKDFTIWDIYGNKFELGEAKVTS